MTARIVRVPADEHAPEVEVGSGELVVCLVEPTPERARSVGDVLSSDEWARVERAVTGRRTEYVAVRGTLRRLLAPLLGVDPFDVPIVYGERGKPELDPRTGTDIAFNASHTEGLAAIALTRGRDVGVDVELRRPRPRLDLLMRGALTPEERGRLEELREDERLVAFLDLWCKKEAYAKLVGLGLGLRFREVAVDDVACAIEPLPLAPEYSGAVAAG